MSEGIVPVVKKSPISIYLRLPTAKAHPLNTSSSPRIQHLLSSTHHLMLPLRLSRIREVKMIPRSMWRQRVDSSSTRDKEKESKRWALGKIEERNRPTPLPRACPSCRRNKQRRMQLAQSSQQKESEMKN
ncbi:hypothetical protein PS2_006809 [Malus domestica]